MAELERTIPFDWDVYNETLTPDVTRRTNSVFELERRGELPKAQLESLQELRRRGLVPSRQTDISLEPEQEAEFQEWMSTANPNIGDPDDHRQQYDYRRAFLSGMVPQTDPATGQQHGASTYKAPDHPNRFVENEQGELIDTITGQRMGAEAVPKDNGVQVHLIKKAPSKRRQLIRTLGELGLGEVEGDPLPEGDETEVSQIQSPFMSAEETEAERLAELAFLGTEPYRAKPFGGIAGQIAHGTFYAWMIGAAGIYSIVTAPFTDDDPLAKLQEQLAETPLVEGGDTFAEQVAFGAGAFIGTIPLMIIGHQAVVAALPGLSATLAGRSVQAMLVFMALHQAQTGRKIDLLGLTRAALTGLMLPITGRVGGTLRPARAGAARFGAGTGLGATISALTGEDTESTVQHALMTGFLALIMGRTTHLPFSERSRLLKEQAPRARRIPPTVEAKIAEEEARFQAAREATAKRPRTAEEELLRLDLEVKEAPEIPNFEERLAASELLDPEFTDLLRAVDEGEVGLEDATTFVTERGADEVFTVEEQTSLIERAAEVPEERAFTLPSEEFAQEAAPVVPAEVIPPTERVPGLEDLEKQTASQMTVEELDVAIEARRLADKEGLVEVFGEQGAKDYERLERIANTSLDPQKADRASEELQERFGDLTPEQERLVFGLGETEPTVEELREIRERKLDLEGAGLPPIDKPPPPEEAEPALSREAFLKRWVEQIEAAEAEPAAADTVPIQEAIDRQVEVVEGSKGAEFEKQKAVLEELIEAQSVGIRDVSSTFVAEPPELAPRTEITPAGEQALVPGTPRQEPFKRPLTPEVEQQERIKALEPVEPLPPEQLEIEEAEALELEKLSVEERARIESERELKLVTEGETKEQRKLVRDTIRRLGRLNKRDIDIAGVGEDIHPSLINAKGGGVILDNLIEAFVEEGLLPDLPATDPFASTQDDVVALIIDAQADLRPVSRKRGLFTKKKAERFPRPLGAAAEFGEVQRIAIERVRKELREAGFGEEEIDNVLSSIEDPQFRKSMAEVGKTPLLRKKTGAIDVDKREPSIEEFELDPALEAPVGWFYRYLKPKRRSVGNKIIFRMLEAKTGSLQTGARYNAVLRRALKQFRPSVFKARDKVRAESRRRIFDFLDGKPVDPKLTPDEMAAAKIMRVEFFDKAFVEFEHENYVFQFAPRRAPFVEDWEVKKFAPQEIENIHRLQRTGDMPGPERDIWYAAKAYIRTNINEKYYNPMIVDIEPQLAKLSPSRRRIADDMLKHQVLAQPTEAQKSLNQSLKSLGEKIGLNLNDRAWEQITGSLHEAHLQGAMAFRIRLVTRNAIQQHIIWIEAGGEPFSWAKKNLSTTEGQNIIDESIVVKARELFFMEDFTKDLPSIYPDKVKRAGMFLYRKIDFNSVKTAVLAGYRKSRLAGESHEEAIAAGNALAWQTQWGYGIDMPGIQTGALRPFTWYMSWPLYYIDYLHTLLESPIKNAPQVGRFAAVAVLAFIIKEVTGINIPAMVAFGPAVALAGRGVAPLPGALYHLILAGAATYGGELKKADRELQKAWRSIKIFFPWEWLIWKDLQKAAEGDIANFLFHMEKRKKGEAPPLSTRPTPPFPSRLEARPPAARGGLPAGGSPRRFEHLKELVRRR
ncbi:hypothetical protein LCGC14_0394190 [marine sediment metagenome]|uniref:Uncharacterized protein n=1 Tax=marine sediment metagenome TaxID=412755 RepID=A0A0F9T4I7_9ZZZZ